MRPTKAPKASWNTRVPAFGDAEVVEESDWGQWRGNGMSVDEVGIVGLSDLSPYRGSLEGVSLWFWRVERCKEIPTLHRRAFECDRRIGKQR